MEYPTLMEEHFYLNQNNATQVKHAANNLKLTIK